MNEQARKPKRKPRRVVLGVGHPWFLEPTQIGRTHLCLSSKPGGYADIGLKFGDLGNWNKVRLVLEVLK